MILSSVFTAVIDLLCGVKRICDKAGLGLQRIRVVGRVSIGFLWWWDCSSRVRYGEALSDQRWG